MNNNSELNAHLKRNENMWQIWVQNGIDPTTEFIVNFHFYTPKKENMELLCKKLTNQNTPFNVKQTRTLIFMKGWKIEAEILKKWALAELQLKTRAIVFLSQQAGVSFEGCSVLMPKVSADGTK